MRNFVMMCCLAAAAAGFASAPEPMHPAMGSSPFQAKRYPAPPLRATGAVAEVLVELPATFIPRSEDATGRERVGIVRPFPDAVAIRGEQMAKRGGTWHWSATFRAIGADRVRLQLRDVVAEAPLTAWVYGESGDVSGFELGAEEWTPSVAGDSITLEVESARQASFAVTSIGELFPPTTEATECLFDASCAGGISETRTAYALLVFASGGSFYSCTGSLIIDRQDTFTPYLLTANHCISTASEAASLEAYWDYQTSFCHGPAPALSSVPRVHGATVLATSPQSDVTLLRLAFSPSGTHWYLGWHPSSVAAGTVVKRVSHAMGLAQVYSETIVDPSSGLSCVALPRPSFQYESQAFGGTAGGSSGAPSYIGDGLIVGQLYGACGTDLSNPCSLLNHAVDGSFAASYPLLQPYLDPTAQPQTCVPNATTACLLNNRFRATVRYRGAFDNQPADTQASVKPVTGFGSATSETVFFYFNSANNIEMLVKMLDQGNTTTGGQQTIAVLYGSATPLRIELTITDMRTGAVKNYTSPFAAMTGGTDFLAFVK